MSFESTLARGWMEIGISGDKAVDEKLGAMTQQVHTFGKQIESGFYEKTIRASRQTVKELDKVKKKAEEVNRAIIHGRFGGRLVGVSEQIGGFVDRTKGINSFALKTNLAFGGLMAGAASSAGSFGIELFGKSAQLAGNALMRPFLPALVEVSALLQRFADKTNKLVEEFPVLTKVAGYAALALGGLAVAGLAASGIRSLAGLVGSGAGLIGRGLGMAGIGMGAGGALVAGGSGGLGLAAAGAGAAALSSRTSNVGATAGAAAAGGIAGRMSSAGGKMIGRVGGWLAALAAIEYLVDSFSTFDEQGRKIDPKTGKLWGRAGQKGGDGFKVAMPNLGMMGGSYYDATGYRESIQSKALGMSELDLKVFMQDMKGARQALDKIVEINQRNAVNPQMAPSH